MNPLLAKNGIQTTTPNTVDDGRAVKLDSKSRIAQLQAQITAQLANKPNLAALTSQSVDDKNKGLKPTPLILNAEGRTVDQSGKEVQLIQRMPTLKANIRAQKKEQFIKLNHEKQSTGLPEVTFQDARLNMKAAVRPKRNFKFHEKGTFESIGQKIRTKVSMILLKRNLIAKYFGDYSFRLSSSCYKRRLHKKLKKPASAQLLD